MNQKELIYNTDWDLLIIFDACRYDYFKKYYPIILGDNFEHRFEKLISPATWTGEWAAKTFKEPMPDTIFISGERTVVNSKKDGFNKIRDFGDRLKYGIDTFECSHIFKEVVDVWLYAQDKSLGSHPATNPDVMFDEICGAFKVYPNDRIMAKYFQIHDPYLYLLDKGYKTFKLDRKIPAIIRKLISEIISDETQWTIRRKLNFPADSWMSKVWYEQKRTGIIKGYCEDLILMLHYVKTFMAYYPEKKIVVTADHGERLGEFGRYSHGGRRDKYVTEIPWLEIERRT